MGGRGSGRIGKPTHLKLLEGEREDRVNRDEPTPEMHDSLEPPVELSDRAREVWDRLAPDMVSKNVLTAWDLDQFVLFCDAVAVYHDCKEQMGGKYTALGAAGGVIKSPYWQIMRDCQSIMTQIGSRYGLTPADRARLSTGADDDSSEDSAERLLS
ncbi:phage terminase small subunit P27 family [Nocardia aobensis]|uniref:Phage terminase small subunit P27 family n=1 Tax=Nocardia aobensis TaxID=257277 RepID=A0ABW6P5W3_9NOCA